MATSGEETISLKTEEEAWDTLEAIVAGTIDPSKINLNFDKADWAKLEILLKGDIFKQTITPSVMKGIVEVQSSFYRSVALILRGAADARRLTDIEKKDFELIFTVEEGSSDLQAELIDVLKQVAGKLADKMSAKHVTILLISLALLYGSHSVATLYINGVNEEKLVEIKSRAETDRTRLLTENETKRTEIAATKDARVMSALEKIVDDTQETKRKSNILTNAGKVVDGVTIMFDDSMNSYDTLIRQSLRAESITIQGKKIGNDVIQEIRQVSRRNSQDIRIKERFFVQAIDGSGENGFTFKVREASNDRLIVATIEDQVVLEKYGKILRERLMDKKTVSLDIRARQIGDEVLDARIIKATPTRKRKGED
ncbi:hypothetical protein [Methylobacterium sp. J-068]|uniref:hypothetical protein n=1 Tax=Methylobacterium sp. J-068 TaxID=2836649 RepID=UPI001FBBD3D7|nr:hypothetical protein [Methylobacterium sp. J-068]MCJ2033171.1 hypothetical protein [Methylobacterium sp. J-068]